jgi:hypothetical protein
MATTCKSIELHQFNDPDFQRLYELLKNADGKVDNKSKAMLLHALAKQAEELAKKISPG